MDFPGKSFVQNGYGDSFFFSDSVSQRFPVRKHTVWHIIRPAFIDQLLFRVFFHILGDEDVMGPILLNRFDDHIDAVGAFSSTINES